MIKLPYKYVDENLYKSYIDQDYFDYQISHNYHYHYFVDLTEIGIYDGSVVLYKGESPNNMFGKIIKPKYITAKNEFDIYFWTNVLTSYTEDISVYYGPEIKKLSWKQLLSKLTNIYQMGNNEKVYIYED
jgi:hypothetical protein